MSREPALTLLRQYATTAAGRNQAEVVAATVAFIDAHADCLLRTCAPGHLTGSAWIVSPERRRVLLTHHRKLDRWLQLGGHADGDPDLLAVALREAAEESGLARVVAVDPGLFDLDRHWIPARAADPGHWHYDFRFLLEADASAPLTISSESKDLAWVELGAVAALSPEASMARMVGKTPPAQSGSRS
jgi:8-oxo-dGTP pyrophosphatase MutT (NUDIX family)